MFKCVFFCFHIASFAAELLLEEQKLPGGQLDVYRTGGFYTKCTRPGGAPGGDLTLAGAWARAGPMLPPDARTGFPHTVKDWPAYERKAAKRRAKARAKEPQS